MRTYPAALALALLTQGPRLLAQQTPGAVPVAPEDGAVPAPAPLPAPPLPPSAPAEARADAAVAPQATGFTFGSYGRVVVASDLRGHSGQPSNVVAFGSRLDAPTYAELQFAYDARFGQIQTRTVATLAFNDNLFHFNGNFNGTFAIRNLYLEERGALLPDLAVWVGSRMYRGDDIYLLNWWPLDNLNTVGGGARYDAGPNLTLAVHAGMNRLDDPYQLQTITVAPREGFGPTAALLLDRPRLITSAKATYWLNGRAARQGLKFSLYGEYHALPSGVRQINDAGAREELPADSGYVVGAQAGAYAGPLFVNLFARYSQGLGAYGDLAVPVASSGTVFRTAERAQDVRLALSANWEQGMFGLMLGAYVRYFRDADPGVFSRNALWEGSVVARPIVYFGQHAGLALEASYQSVAYDELDPVTGTGALRGSVFRFGAIPFITPGGRGSYTRPHLQLIYAATVRDAGALRLYAPGDPQGLNSVVHFLGVGTEWWFNSSYL